MTDTPIDQARERVSIFAADLGAADWTSALLKAYNPTGSTEVSYEAAKAALASDLAALSRRVPASGELDERADELWQSLLPYMQVASHASGAHSAYDDKVKALDLIRTALASLPLPVAGAPEGWRLVPVEPTEAMYEGGNAATAFASYITFSEFAHCYKVALAASPPAPEWKAEPEWIDWPGGFDNPVDLTVIETKLRNGTTRKVYAHLVKWTHDQSPFDVVAYRRCGHE